MITLFSFSRVLVSILSEKLLLLKKDYDISDIHFSFNDKIENFALKLTTKAQIGFISNILVFH